MFKDEKPLKLIAVHETIYHRLRHIGFATYSFNQIVEKLLSEGEQRILTQ
jgi:hypothetical protein